MPFIATQDAKEQIRQSIDIVKLIGSSIPLRRQGHMYVGQCPWHDDSRPSLHVNPDRQSWKCWVCDIGGDIFSFVMQRERVDFKEALTLLADEAGVSLSASSAPITQPGDPNDKKTILAAVAWAERMFAECLQSAADAQVAREYFQERGIDADSMRRFRLGFSPDSWQWLQDRARSASISTAVLESVGLIGKSAATGRFYDRFKGRVIFPIRDAQARPIAFGGRVLPQFANDKSAKYVNSPETRLFSKSDNVYGLDMARDAISKSRQVVVVEGYTDTIMAHQFGLQNTVAVLGTALGPRHIQLLRRYADTIVLVLDGDEAGQRRTNEVLELFVAGEVDLRILTLPSELDPCDFLLEHGVDAMREQIENAHDAFEHAVRVHTTGIDLIGDTHRANKALEQLLGTLAKAPRLTSDTKSARLLRERQVLTRLARNFHVDEATLRQRISELRAASSARSSFAPSDKSTPVRLEMLTSVEEELFEILVQHPALVDTALEGISRELLGTATAQRVFDHYQSLSDAGEVCEFHRIMTAIEDPPLKHLLVALDEQSIKKEEFAQESAGSRLQNLIETLQFQSEDQQSRDRLAELEGGRVSDDEELAILNDLVDRQRKRQGIPAPTDG